MRVRTLVEVISLCISLKYATLEGSNVRDILKRIIKYKLNLRELLKLSSKRILRLKIKYPLSSSRLELNFANITIIEQKV